MQESIAEIMKTWTVRAEYQKYVTAPLPFLADSTSSISSALSKMTYLSEQH